MRLHEIANLTQQEQSHLEVNSNNTKAWLDRVGIRNYTILPNGVVDVDDSVDLSNKNLTVIPVQFGNVAGDFFVSVNQRLTSLKGSPHTVGGSFNCSSTGLTSLEYAPSRVIDGDVFCDLTNITSLHDVHKMIKEVNGVFACDKKVTHVLGLLLIKGITNIDVDSRGPIDDIVNKYIGTDDIIAAQDELIDAGFVKQARL